MAGTYLVAYGPSSGTGPASVLTFFDEWQLTKNLDDGCTFSFSCPGDSLPGVEISELATDIWLYLDGVLIERFRVLEVTQDWTYDGNNQIAVACCCYRRLLASRYVNSALSYTGLSQGLIVASLISHTQSQVNGNLGIVLGSAGPVVPRDRSYEIGANILESIVELSQIAQGIVWRIDPFGALIVTQIPTTYPAPNPQPVVLGANALSITKPSGSALFANVAIVTGDSVVTTPVVVPTAGLSTDPRGRWEKFRGLPQEQTQANLTQQANGIVTESQSPQIVYTFSLEPIRYFLDSNYDLGEIVTVVQPGTVVPSTANPTISILTVPAVPVISQIISQSISQDSDGLVTVQMQAIALPESGG
jgi:hypothetical protein